MLKRVALIIACSSLLATGTANAGVYYKWTDEKGVIHYGQTPPEGSDAQPVKTYDKTPSGQKQALDNLDKRRNQWGSDSKREADEQKLKDADAAQEAARKEQCQRAKDNLKVLNEHSRIREIDENGEYRRLNEEERQEKIKRNTELKEKLCTD